MNTAQERQITQLMHIDPILATATARSAQALPKSAGRIIQQAYTQARNQVPADLYTRFARVMKRLHDGDTYIIPGGERLVYSTGPVHITLRRGRDRDELCLVGRIKGRLPEVSKRVGFLGRDWSSPHKDAQWKEADEAARHVAMFVEACRDT